MSVLVIGPLPTKYGSMFVNSTMGRIWELLRPFADHLALNLQARQAGKSLEMEVGFAGNITSCPFMTHLYLATVLHGICKYL